MAKLYLPNGFLDFEKLEKLSSTLNIVIGARNSGKTYGALLHFCGAGRPFIFLRTQKSQIDLVFSDELSPFNKLNRDLSTRYFVDKVDKSGLIGVYNDYTEKDGKRAPAGNLVGYCLALSQVGATRGFNLDNVDVLIYDEFVNHPGEVVRGANKQFTMYADIVFTLNRAREMEGRPAIRQWLFGNSDDLANNILLELRIVNMIIKMRQAGQNYLKLPDRDISIFLLDDSPAAKRLAAESSLSKVFAGSSYTDMAYKNEFVYDDFSDCKPADLHAYKPIYRYGNMVCYEHKRQDSYYLRTVEPGAVFAGIPFYPTDQRGTTNAREEHAYLFFSWLACNVSFDSFATKARFLKLYNLDKK